MQLVCATYIYIYYKYSVVPLWESVWKLIVSNESRAHVYNMQFNYMLNVHVKASLAHHWISMRLDAKLMQMSSDEVQQLPMGVETGIRNLMRQNRNAYYKPIVQRFSDLSDLSLSVWTPHNEAPFHLGYCQCRQ